MEEFWKSTGIQVGNVVTISYLQATIIMLHVKH